MIISKHWELVTNDGDTSCPAVCMETNWGTARSSHVSYGKVHIIHLISSDLMLSELNRSDPVQPNHQRHWNWTARHTLSWLVTARTNWVHFTRHTLNRDEMKWAKNSNVNAAFEANIEKRKTTYAVAVLASQLWGPLGAVVSKGVGSYWKYIS